MLVYQRVPHENAVLLEANLNYFDWAYFPVCYVKLPEGSSPHPNWNSMNEYLVVAFFAATKLTQWTEGPSPASNSGASQPKVRIIPNWGSG